MQAHYADTVLTFADSWESLTLAQYEAVVTAPDVYGMLLAVCDKPHLLDMLPDPMAETELTSRLPFLATAPPTFNEWPCPNVLLVNGKALPLPANFDLETFGQMKAAEKLQGPVLSVYAHLLAIYMYPHLTGLPFRYEGTDIGPTVRLIRGLPARDVIPLGSFFLLKLNEARSSGRVSYRERSKTRTPITGRRQITRCLNWLNSLRTLLFGPWQRTGA